MNILVARIKTISFSINEKMYLPDLPNIRYNLKHRLGVNLDKDLVNLTIKVKYAYPEKEDLELMNMEVESVFIIPNIKDYVPPEKPFMYDKMNLPNEILTLITGASLAHTRALLATNTAGTIAEQMILPLIDINELVLEFFGKKVD